MRVWEEFLKKEEGKIGRAIVDKWLRPLKVVRFDACNLYLEAPDSFYIVWFEEHIRHILKSELIGGNNKPIKVYLHLPPQENPQEEAKKKRPQNSYQKPNFDLRFEELDEEKTFGNFVFSESNELAFRLISEASGYQTSQDSKTIPLQFNPIFLFGRKGVGKTHLLNASALELRKAGKKVIFVKAETFTEHVVNAIRTGEMQLFRKAYRNADALIIDDVEVFGKKGATQEELFHTFNTLHVEGKQIVLSSSFPPSELKFIEPRLISRFEWGIVIPMLPLERDKLKELLLKRAQHAHFPLEDSVTEFLLDTFKGNTKSLLRSLEALILRTHLNASIGTHSELPLKLATAKKYLADLIQEEEKSILTPNKIIKTVAEHYGIKTDDILSKSQNRECVLPRQIAMHLCRDRLNLPFMKIGELFARDHSTVMSSCKLVQKEVEAKNPEIATSLYSILKRLDP